MSSERTQGRTQTDDRAALESRRRILHWLIRKVVFHVFVKFDRVEGLENLPPAGPAIVMMNHIALMDPVVVMGALPRLIVPVSKAEGFRSPIFGPPMTWWRVIPIQRGEADRQALRLIFEALEAGEVILMAPEGTRHHALGEVHPGVAYIAHRSGVPIVPVALEGTDGFPTLNPRRWWRPGGVVTLGRPFRYRTGAGRPSREQLRLMIDEAMYVLAAMLPEARRGIYSDLSQATTQTIEFLQE